MTLKKRTFENTVGKGEKADDKNKCNLKIDNLFGMYRRKLGGKCENDAGYQHFLLFPPCFQKPGLCGKGWKKYQHFPGKSLLLFFL